MGGSTSRIHLRFAATSLLALAIIGVIAGLLGAELVRISEADSNGQHTGRLVAEPLSAIVSADAPTVSDPLSNGARRQLDAVTAALVGPGIRAIRVWTLGGVLLYSAGAPAPEGRPALPSSKGVTSERRSHGNVSDLVTYLNAGAYLIEVDEPSAAVDSSTRTTQWMVGATVALAAMLFFGITQMSFRISVHGLVSDHRRLRRIYASGEDLRSSLELHDVTAQIATDVTSLARGEFGIVALFEQDTGELILRATYERIDGAVTHHQRAIDEWFLRRCVATNTTIINAQAASAYRGFFGADVLLEGQLNVLCVPMALRDRVVGVVAVLRPPSGRNDGFAPIEVRQALDIAAQGAMAVEQAELFAKVRSYATEVELSYDSTLKALVAALDAKDDVTEGHCERVSKLTVQFARHLNVDERSLVDIERGALLHDVGKIGVPDAVLKKPAALNDGEWEAMRKHPLLAGVMISKVGFLEGATPILLYHHERYDGGGYPFGLTADKIPLEARIFAVVDAYDAMMSDRPYRQAIPHDAAMLEISSNSGTQFDPEIAAAFERMMLSRPDLRRHIRATRRTDHGITPQPQDADSAA